MKDRLEHNMYTCIFTYWINAYCILFYPDHVSGKSTGKRKTPSKEIDEVESEDLTDIETGNTIYKGFLCSCIQTSKGMCFSNSLCSRKRTELS